MPEEMVQEGTPIEEAMEEVIGCGTTCMSHSSGLQLGSRQCVEARS